MTDQYRDLAESATTNGNLKVHERETTINFARDEDRARVHTDEPALAKRLLMHPEFDLTAYHTSDPETVQQRVDVETYEEEGHDKRKPVYGVLGTIPVGVIKIRPNSRKNTGHAAVVTGEYSMGEDL